MGDLVYFDGDGYKGVGKIVEQDVGFKIHYLVQSTQIKKQYTGKVSNRPNWWFLEEHLKPFTKKVGQKYIVTRVSPGNNNLKLGEIVTLFKVSNICSHYIGEDGLHALFDIDQENSQVAFYQDEQYFTEEESNMFTKDDLEVGYMVKTKSGKFAEVVFLKNEGISILYADRDGLSLRDYGDDLIYNGRAHDIEEVYGYAETWSDLARYGAGDRELLWKRKEVKEMTLSELQEHFGYEIKVVD